MTAKNRWFILFVVVALALGGLGVTAVSAANRAADPTHPAQADGKAWLGVRVTDGRTGVTIAFVAPGSPAETAGLRIGDVIKAVDDVEINSAADLVDVIQSYQPGDEVILTVSWRNTEREVPVVLGDMPGEPQPPVVVRPWTSGALNFLGLSARMTADGLLVDSIDRSSPLAGLGLQRGDLITAVNGEDVTNLTAGALVRSLIPGKPIVLTVERGGEELTIEIEVPAVGVDIMPLMPGAGSGMMPRMQLGVAYITLTPAIAEEHGLDVDEGALIERVYEGTPAEEAGLQAGDIITAVEGDVVDQRRTLGERLFAYDEGEVVTLAVLRDGEEIEIEITLGPSTTRIGVLPGMMQRGQHWQRGRTGQGMMPFFHHFGQGMPGGLWHNFMGPDGTFEFRFNMPEIIVPEQQPATPGQGA